VRYILINALIIMTMTAFSQDFEVAPVLVSFDANPGENQTQKLAIRNHGNDRQTFVLNLVDFLVNEEGAKITAEAGSTNRTVADWITVNPSFVELNPNESAGVDLIISVPRTGFSTRWGMIQVQVAKEQLPSEADKQLSTGVVIVPRIVVLVKQSPRSNQNYRGMVSDLREIEEDAQGYRNFEAVLTNTGDKILDANVFLALANLETAEEKQFTKHSVTIYPERQRRVVLRLEENPATGQYALAVLMDYGHGTAIEGAQMLLNVE
jgi:hypothetical protein